ncbi:hypothetical protein F4801DRAFT_64016 [Xylaria longipes]|nr:hypothetical protein F4801DRAFT_64016 [Xylaria longipes]
MISKQQAESPLRLENLGHVSGFYGNLPIMKEWSPVGSNDLDNKSPFYPGKKQYVAYSDFNTTGLKPAKRLHQNRHPDILRPGTPLTAMSEYRGDETQRRLRHPVVLTPGLGGDNKCIDYFARQPLKSSYAHTPRPVSSYSAYRHPEFKPLERPRDRIVRTSISLCESPSTYSEYHGSHTPSPPAYWPRRDEHLTRGYSFSEIPRSSPVCPHSQATMLVDGVEFNLVSSNTPAPVPAPIRRPAPPSAPSPSRRSFTPSIRPRANSDSLAYGAWNPNPIRPKQPSFVDRARARLERGFRVGWRSPPSFKVNEVLRSPSSSLRMWQGNEKCESPSPIVSSPSTESSWTEPTQMISQKTPLAGSYLDPELESGDGESKSSRQPVAITSGGKKSGEIGSSGSEGADAELVYAQQTQFPDYGLPTPAPSPSPPRRMVPDLRVNTKFSDVSLPVGIFELEAPLNNPFQDKNKANGPLSRRSSNDSLFLDRDKVDMRHEAGSTFFSSDYTQKRVVATDIESRAPGPRVQSSVSPYQSSQSREQLKFATLPSPPGDIGRPFPFNDRSDLPSQNQQIDAAKRHTLSRKQGMRLR